MTPPSLVSVIIPAYNRADLLPRAIDSVLAQTYQHFEIIIVDDASTDDTQAVVQAIGDRRIRYLRHERNQGGASARNTGIDAASGEFVAFLDSDDVWLPEKLERQLDFIGSSGEDSGNTLYYAQSVSDDGLKKIVLPKRGKLLHEALTTYLFQKGGDVQTISVILNRELAAKIRFRADLKRHQDWDFYIRLEKSGVSFAFLSEPLSVYYRDSRPDRIGASSVTSLSHNWLAENQDSFSPAAARAFRAELIAPRLAANGSPGAAARLVIFAWISQSISIGHAAKLLANFLFPPAITVWLKRAYGRISPQRYAPRPNSGVDNKLKTK